jgi:hypothetical protein
MIAIACIFIHPVTRVVLLQVFMFGGKDVTGDGTPEGLPLNCRFFHLSPTLSWQERGRSGD